MEDVVRTGLGDGMEEKEGELLRLKDCLGDLGLEGLMCFIGL